MARQHLQLHRAQASFRRTSSGAVGGTVHTSRLKRFAEKTSLWFLDVFDTAAVALVTLVLMLLVTATVYFWLHRHPKTEAELERDLRNAVIVSPDGFCHLSYDDGELAKWFGQGEIDLFKSRLKEKAADIAHQNALERRQVLAPLRAFADRGLSEVGPLQFLPTSGPDTDDAPWNSVLLDETALWLKARGNTFVPEKQIEYQRYLEMLGRQAAREHERAERLKREVQGLDSSLSFDWLQVENSKWILEVIAWTIFGVIANTTIGLVESARKGTYKADEFVLFLPKMFLAPVLSVVAIALWSSGFTTAPISFLNLPLFLVLSFSLGLVTEQVYTALRKAAQWLVARFVSIDEEKFAAAAKNLPYTFVNPKPAPASATGDAAPANLKQLAAALQTQASADVERGLVSKLANTNPPPS